MNWGRTRPDNTDSARASRSAGSSEPFGAVSARLLSVRCCRGAARFGGVGALFGAGFGAEVGAALPEFAGVGVAVGSGTGTAVPLGG